MTKDMKSKAVYAAVIAVLCVIFVCLFGFGLKKVLAMEGAFPPVVNVDGITPAPKSKAEVIAFLNRALNNAAESKPKLSSSDSFGIDDESIQTSGSAAFKQNLLFFKGSFISKLSESRAAYDGNFGDDITSRLNAPIITEQDIEDFECDYMYYACTSCGHGEKEQLPQCEECTEVIIAGKADDKAETIYEISDLTYHVMVLMIEMGISLEDIHNELASRHVIDKKVKQEKMTSGK